MERSLGLALRLPLDAEYGEGAGAVSDLLFHAHR